MHVHREYIATIYDMCQLIREYQMYSLHVDYLCWIVNQQNHHCSNGW